MTDGCVSCRSLRAALVCGICQGSLCKACDQLKYADLDSMPPEIKAVHACSACFEASITPAIEARAQLLERARQVHVFTVNQRAPIPVLKRAKRPIEIKDRVDRDEATLELALLAAKDGYNAIIDSEIVFKKARHEGYEKKLWSIRALPAVVDAEKLARRELRDP